MASSRVIWPSSLPSVAAHAELEVASALKPMPAMTQADPPSQTFGITNAPAAWCSARKRCTLSFCSCIIADLRHTAAFAAARQSVWHIPFLAADWR